jgi:mannose-6-phosphate isomerase-like protein (cupin superfamily)
MKTFWEYVGNIETDTLKNKNYRKVIDTDKHSQLVLMSLKPGEEIGEEVHDNIDQFFRIEGGSGKLIMGGKSHTLKDGIAFVVPAGTKHNVINTSKTEPLKLYSIYSPAQHPKKTIHKTKADEGEH